MGSESEIKVYKSIGELDGLTGELTGAEILPIVKSGKAFKKQISEFYGDLWFSALRSKLADFVAPNATKAEQANFAALADDADAVNGISLADGTGIDLYEEVAIKPGEFWVIPRGSFLLFVPAADITGLTDLYLSADDARAQGFWMLKAPFPSGLVLSDGVSQRIRNKGTVSHILTYRVLAHAA